MTGEADERKRQAIARARLMRATRRRSLGIGWLLLAAAAIAGGGFWLGLSGLPSPVRVALDPPRPVAPAPTAEAAAAIPTGQTALKSEPAAAPLAMDYVATTEPGTLPEIVARPVDIPLPAPAAGAKPPASKEAPFSKEALVGATAVLAPPPVHASPAPTAETKLFIARAREFMAQGDLTTARLFLERASRLDDTQAAYMLAQTYDPDVLARWKVLGVSPNVDKARALYAQAAAAGLKEASNRLSELNRN